MLLQFTSVSFPNVTAIGDMAFYGCAKLAGVTLPEQLTAIGELAFYDCDAIQSMRIPSGVKVLPRGVFWNCDALVSVELPAGLTEIGPRAFIGCNALTKIRIPASVTSIGEEAFSMLTLLDVRDCPAAYEYALLYDQPYVKEDAPTMPSDVDTVPEIVAWVVSQHTNSGMSEYEKALRLYNWVCANVEYDYDYLDTGISTSPHGVAEEGALLDGIAVCQGYADAYTLLLQKAGLNAMTVSGYARESGEGHAWNLVKIDGQWYQFDSTWDDAGKAARHTYFGLTDAAMETDHHRETDLHITCVSYDANYNYRNGRYDKILDALIAAVNGKIAAGEMNGFVETGIEFYYDPDLMTISCLLEAKTDWDLGGYAEIRPVTYSEYAYTFYPSEIISGLRYDMAQPAVNQPLTIMAALNAPVQFVYYTVYNSTGVEITISGMETAVWTPQRAGMYQISAVVYDGTTWASKDTEWFAVIDPFQLKALALDKTGYAPGDSVTLRMDATGEMQFASYQIIDGSGAEMFKSVTTETSIVWENAKAGTYKAIVVAYDGEWHSAETGWFKVATPFLIKSVSPTEWQNLTTASTLVYSVDLEGTPQFLHYTLYDKYGNTPVVGDTTEKTIRITPPYASDFMLAVIGYDGTTWSGADSNWVRVDAEKAVLKGLNASAGSLKLGESVRFALDMTGPFDFAKYTVYNQYGAEVANQVLTEKQYTFAPEAAGDYFCEVVVYDGANWLSAKTGWISVREEATQVRGLQSKKGAYSLGEAMNFSIDMTGPFQFAKFTVYNHYGVEVASGTTTQKNYAFTPMIADDYYCDVVVYDGANWHSAKTGWISVTGE